jgi:small neutral amino acid transporter SnatA (MarC family)
MGKLKLLFGLGAACAACCAIPLAVPLIAAASTGLGFAGLGAALSSWWVVVAGLAAAAIGLAVFLHRRHSIERCAVPER